MTPEGKVKEQIKKLLKKYGVFYHMPVMNGMGKPTLDFICCHNSRFIAIEAKAPGQKATLRQELTMQEMRNAGAYVFLIDGNEHRFDVLEAFLQLVGP